MTTWDTRAPIDVLDNAQTRRTVLYGPRGEALVVREPRRLGFREPSTCERHGHAPDNHPPQSNLPGWHSP
jgi:hypothetical protein